MIENWDNSPDYNKERYVKMFDVVKHWAEPPLCVGAWCFLHKL